LTRFPGSVRAGVAALALGWNLVIAGRLDDAAGQFRRALTDPSERVRAGAAAGLAEIARLGPDRSGDSDDALDGRQLGRDRGHGARDLDLRQRVAIPGSQLQGTER
jgi:hypothetical protein